MTIKRGDLFYANLGNGIGSEQGKTRPVIVVQNDVGNRYSPTVVIIPLTSSKKKKLPTHVDIPVICGLGKHSLAMAEQIRTIDRSRLSGYIGYVDENLQSSID